MECFALNINYKAYNLIRCWVSVAVNLGSRHHTLLGQFVMRTPGRPDQVGIRTRQAAVIRARHVHYDKVAVRLSNAVHIGHGQDYCHLATTHCSMSAGLGDSSQWLYYNIAGVVSSGVECWSAGVLEWWSDVDIWFE